MQRSKFKSRQHRRINKKSRKARRPIISDARLERGLRVLSETKDIVAAARAIRVSPNELTRIAKRRRAIRKIGGRWTVARRLPRHVPIFTDGQQLAITARGRSATLAGRYMSGVGQFLKTNDPKHLEKFKGRGVKDVRGKFHEFETNENQLYRLSSAGGEPFEEFYRIIL